MIINNTFKSRSQLDRKFAQRIAKQLTTAISDKGYASIAFSGGSTPKGLFNELSNKNIDWSNVTITLVDDRWVDTASKDSNDRLLRENLLQNYAAKATFFSLKQAENLSEQYLANITEQASRFTPLDVVILGMGEDGHTASIFPCSAQVHQGLDELADPALIKVVPTTAPYERVTFNYAAIIQASHLYLHVVGQSKQDVISQALADDDATAMPIRAFLQNKDKTCNIFWAE
ncbi:6-phosphogluconolactonase [Thalassotalea psychrophila]|uniref:6-phosphogluconolactonase n=1 Tax=Thalassotalea psychrophila TaxID=3065647 RepID=A0ABY9TP45_9GAMM|nr:6-phosphogluconolactonase [Colwelliaceae bacterium SQ149]